MFVIGDLIYAAADIINFILEIYKWMIIIAALMSWVNPDPYNPIVRFLHSATEPVLRPVRNIIGYRLGPIDISPFIVILVIIFTQRFLIRVFVKFAYRLGGG